MRGASWDDGPEVVAVVVVEGVPFAVTPEDRLLEDVANVGQPVGSLTERIARTAALKVSLTGSFDTLSDREKSALAALLLCAIGDPEGLAA